MNARSTGKGGAPAPDRGSAEAIDLLVDGKGRLVAGDYALYGAGAGIPRLLAMRLP
jgi:hypothetical protein